ncbi:MAG: DUF4272 domain-containing protein [Capsulimonas sp.]|uniref:DUF4272 domain-containing protein n=1 Tax=Capsulimonas sp. TaxID=2494211 RepID=UPI003265EC93
MTTLINIYSTLRAPSALDFPHELVGHRTLSDPDLTTHLNGFAGYVQSRGDGQMTQTRYHVLLHILRVRRQFSIHVEDQDFEAMAQWVWRANGICFTPEGAVRDPDGLILVGPGGENDPEAQVPYPPDAVDRKTRMESVLMESGIRTPTTLPPVIGASEVELQTASEVAQRALALFLPSLKAESLDLNQPIPTVELQTQFPLGFEALTPMERSFIFSDPPSQQDIVNFAWRYEAQAALQWALGLSELPWPTQNCDVAKAARNILNNNSAAFIQSAVLRPTEEILDALDLHYRLHWAVREAHQQELSPPAQLEPGVISERHHALNWLVRFENADWDDVDTPT